MTTAIPSLESSPLPPLDWVGMTRARLTPGRPLGPPRVLVLHATAGSGPGDLNWLRKGGGDPPLSPVSCGYYISKAGRIAQLVRDEDSAWHCGPSSWMVDGRLVSGSHQGVSRMNLLSLGIELENRNNANHPDPDVRDPYPEAQIAAAVALARYLVARYQIPRTQLVRHLDIAPGRKTDPAGFPWAAFVEAVYAPGATPAPGPRTYTADSPIMGPPPAGLTREAFAEAAARRTAGSGHYTRGDVAGVIAPAYWHTCGEAGVDPVLALAQCFHETGRLTAALSHRTDRHGQPLRNPAGIGVTGASSKRRLPGYVWDADRGIYRAAVGFTAWAGPGGSIEAHVGRLVAYATPPAGRTPQQARLVAVALAARTLPAGCQGSAPTLRALGHGPNPVAGCGWAGANDSQGHDYGQRVADHARALLALAEGA